MWKLMNEERKLINENENWFIINNLELINEKYLMKNETWLLS